MMRRNASACQNTGGLEAMPLPLLFIAAARARLHADERTMYSFRHAVRGILALRCAAAAALALTLCTIAVTLLWMPAPDESLELLAHSRGGESRSTNDVAADQRCEFVVVSAGDDAACVDDRARRCDCDAIPGDGCCPGDAQREVELAARDFVTTSAGRRCFSDPGACVVACQSACMASPAAAAAAMKKMRLLLQAAGGGDNVPVATVDAPHRAAATLLACAEACRFTEAALVHAADFGAPHRHCPLGAA
jgi:hypothetical protein